MTASTPDVSIVIPAFGEEARIARTLCEVVDFFSRLGPAFEVIVIDDGSPDATAAAARNAVPADSRVRVMELPAHAGKGAAVRAGVLASRGELVLMSDADLSIPLEEYPAFSQALRDGADIAIASKELGRREGLVRQPLSRALMGRVFNLCVRALVLPGLRDTQGGFKLFRGDAARRLAARGRINGFAFDVEFLALARASGCRIVELPVHCRMSGGTSVRLLSDSLRMVLDLVRIRRTLKELPEDSKRA